MADGVLSSVKELSREKRKEGPEGLLQTCNSLWSIVADLQVGKGSRPHRYAAKFLKEVMSLMDSQEMKNAGCFFKLSRCALALLRVEGSTQGFPASGVQQAYLNIARGLFKYSKKGEHDKEFMTEQLAKPLLDLLQSSEDPSEAGSSSNDLRVYAVGVLKNISQEDETIQDHLAESGAIGALFRVLEGRQFSGSSKEADLLIQATAALRNLAGRHHQEFLADARMDALTRIFAVFPTQVELMTNVSRILSKLTLHGDACDAFAQKNDHLRQLSRTLTANPDSVPLALRLSFVLGNLTEGDEDLRVAFAFDCEGTVLVPQLLSKFWQKDRQLARIAHTNPNSSGQQQIEEVLVKLVRLLANMAISEEAGKTLSSSSAVVDPLLDMLGAKRIGDSEELVLNVVAAVTNLMYYEVSSNLLFADENKQLLCRLFRPLLLESYNVEALVETARALGNLSRHQDARQTMANLRLDEILVILLDHESRDLVFYVCGALVNLAADPTCTERLTRSSPIARKLSKLLSEAPADDPALMLVGVKVLTNLSLDASVAWGATDVESIRQVLVGITSGGNIAAAMAEEEEDEAEAAERQQLMALATQLLGRLPDTGVCP